MNMSFISYQMKKLLPQRIMAKTTGRSDLSIIVYCEVLYCLWDRVRIWLLPALQLLLLTNRNTHLGLLSETSKMIFENHILLAFKRFLSSAYKRYIINIYKVEKRIATDNGKLESYYDKWEPLLKILNDNVEQSNLT